MFKFNSFKFTLMVAAVVLISSLTVGCSKKAIQELIGSLKGDFYEGDSSGPPAGVSVGNIHGEVKDALTNNVIVGQVFLESDRGPKPVPIQPNGGFDFINVPMYRDYNIRVEAFGYYPYMNSISLKSSYFNVGTISMTKMADNVYNQTGEIAGRVTDDTGNPVNGANVMYYGFNDKGAALNTVSTYTDASGNRGIYSFVNIKDGIYWIAANKYPDYGMSDYQQVTVVAGRKTDNINLSVRKQIAAVATGMISGRITDQNGMGIEQARITISPSIQGITEVRSQGGGNFYIYNVPISNYQLNVAAGSFTPMGSAVPIEYSGTIVNTYLSNQEMNKYVDIRVTSKAIANDPKVTITNPANNQNLSSKTVNLQFNVENVQNISRMWIMASGNALNGSYYENIAAPFGSTYTRQIDLGKYGYSGGVTIMVHFVLTSGFERSEQITVTLPSDTPPTLQPTVLINSPTAESTVSGEALTISFTLTNVEGLKVSAKLYNPNNDPSIDNWIQTLTDEYMFGGAAKPYSGSWTLSNVKLDGRYKGHKVVIRAEGFYKGYPDSKEIIVNVLN